MQLTDKDGNIFGTGGLEITTSSGKPKVPVINTDITIGTTAIVGGVAGRLLFEGAGNVVQESPSIFWDIAGSKLNLGSLGVQGELVINRASTGGSVGGVKAEASGAGVHIGGGGYYDSIVMTNGSGVRFNTYNGGSVSAERARITGTTGNFLINTTTDSGFKFDVAGTARIQSTLSISNPSFISGGSITHSANATLVITGGPGGGTENITFGPSNRIFINAAQSRFPNGSVQIASTLSVGVANATSQNMIWATGGITASSAIARGIYTDTTLTASANNDVLVGLDIAPTFTNGAFTGVSNFAARFGGDAVFTHGNRNIRVLNPTSGNGGSISITSGSATTSGTGGDIYLNVGSGAGGPGPGRIYLGNNNGWDVCYVRGLLTINNSGPNTGSAFQVNAGGQNGLTIFWDNLTPYMAYGLVSGRQSRFVNSTSYTFSSKVFIGTNTDAGFTFDVNGSARVQNGLTVSGSLNLNSSDISSAWTTYTPTWSTDGATQPSLGDGTITGAYKVIGKTVFVRVRLVFGTTTTAGTGTFYFSLPVNAAAAWGVQMPASILDNGNAWYQATVNGEYGGFTDKVALITQSAGGANSSQGVTGVFPITFASTDSIQFNGSYESV